MARRISLVNQKGGVGKTTTVVNLAACLALRGKRVLLLDYDPQASASHYVGLSREVVDNNRNHETSTLYTAVTFTEFDSQADRGMAFSPTELEYLPRLHIIPGARQLSFKEYQWFSEPDGAHKLRRAVERIESNYDFILVDCPPTLGILGMNAWIACPEVVIPVDTAPLALPGAVELRDFLIKVHDDGAPQVKLLGVVANCLIEGTVAAISMLEHLRTLFGDRLFTTVIHDSQAIRMSPLSEKPIVVSEPKSRATQEYNNLAAEIIARG